VDAGGTEAGCSLASNTETVNAMAGAITWGSLADGANAAGATLARAEDKGSLARGEEGGSLASNPTDTMAEARRSLAPRLSAWAPWPAAQRHRTPWLTTRTAPCMVECAFNGLEEQFRVRLVGYTKVSSQASIVQTGSFCRLNSTLSQTLVHLALYGLHNRERNQNS